VKKYLYFYISRDILCVWVIFAKGLPNLLKEFGHGSGTERGCGYIWKELRVPPSLVDANIP
jgi:hypothetical protein